MSPAGGRARVAITGFGAVTPLGLDTDLLFEALKRGEHGIRPVTRFDTSDLGVHVAALVPWTDPVPEGLSLADVFAIRAAEEALERAGLLGERPEGFRLALIVGTLGDFSTSLAARLDRIARHLRANGPRIVVSTACSSSANAIGLGRDLLLADDADAVLAGGVDEQSKALFSGFHALGVLSKTACTPFGSAYGTTLGEGAGFVVLRRSNHARTYVLGYGLSSDAHHETTPHPLGRGVSRAIESALHDANTRPEEIGYINAHATGTETNDEAEWRGITSVFGTEPPPVSGSKGHLGHAQGAAGVLELILTLRAQEADLLLPTLGFDSPRPRGPRDPVGGAIPRSQRYARALSTSNAFAGSNCAICVGEPIREAPVQQRRVYLIGQATVGRWTSRTHPPMHRLEGADDLRRIAPRVDPRNLDPSAMVLVGATRWALRDAELAMRGSARERTGIVLGATRVSPESVRAYQRSIRDRGYARVDTAAFARLILHAPAGRASIAEDLRGPASSLQTGASSGLAALAYAAALIRDRTDVDAMVAAGLDEHETLPVVGAASAVLGAEPRADSVELLGWGFGGDLEAAAASALRSAGISSAEVTHLVGDEVPGIDARRSEPDLEDAPSLRSMIVALDAARLARCGHVVMAAVRGEGASVAVLMGPQSPRTTRRTTDD